MKQGNWIKFDKDLVRALPKKRPYTFVEAAYSYQVDIMNDSVKSISYYEKLWQWKNTKTSNFIKYRKGTLTEESRNTKNVISFRFFENNLITQKTEKDTPTGYPRGDEALFINDSDDTHGLPQGKEEVSLPTGYPRGDEALFINDSDDTHGLPHGIYYKNKEKEYIVVFEELWKDYPNKEGRKKAYKYFISSVKTDQDVAAIRTALKNYLHILRSTPWRSAQLGKTWFKSWRDFAPAQGTPEDTIPSRSSPVDNSLLDKIRNAEREVDAYTEV